jgi:nucleoside phosphorylase
VNFGDLIVFETTYDWDYGKWEEDKDLKDGTVTFKARPVPLTIDGSAAQIAARELIASDFKLSPKVLRELKEKSLGEIQNCEIHLKPVASGAAVVGHESIIARIRGLNDAIWGVDMESYGLYYACRHMQVVTPEYLCIKAVADFCDGNKGDKYHNACSHLSASAALALMTKHWDFSR